MLKIKVPKKGKKLDIEKALKMYKSKIRDTNMMKELQDRKEYTKKSEKRRHEKNKAIYINNKYNK